MQDNDEELDQILDEIVDICDEITQKFSSKGIPWDVMFPDDVTYGNKIECDEYDCTVE